MQNLKPICNVLKKLLLKVKLKYLSLIIKKDRFERSFFMADTILINDKFYGLDREFHPVFSLPFWPDQDFRPEQFFSFYQFP